MTTFTHQFESHPIAWGLVRTALPHTPVRGRDRTNSPIPFSARTASCAPMIMGKKPRKTHRVAIMSTTGGGAATVADRLGTLGIDVVGPTQQVIDNLAGNSAIRAGPFLQSSPIC